MALLGPIIHASCGLDEHVFDVRQFGDIGFRCRVAAKLIGDDLARHRARTKHVFEESFGSSLVPVFLHQDESAKMPREILRRMRAVRRQFAPRPPGNQSFSGVQLDLKPACARKTVFVFITKPLREGQMVEGAALRAHFQEVFEPLEQHPDLHLGCAHDSRKVCPRQRLALDTSFFCCLLKAVSNGYVDQILKNRRPLASVIVFAQAVPVANAIEQANPTAPSVLKTGRTIVSC